MIGLGLGYTLPGKGSAPEAPSDTTAPSITSANPSGSYEEGVAIGGTLTAGEEVTFSVTGTDADAVTLDPETGVWSLEETVYATKASYSFSFVATDAAENASEPQVVAITITEADEEPTLTAPVLSNLTSGWTTGDNPPAWSAYYADAVGYGDGEGSEVRARWRIDEGDWTTEEWEGLDDELITGELTWPLLVAADLSAGGAFEVQEQHVIDRGLDTEVMSAWSETWADTLDIIEPEPVGVVWTVNSEPPAAINKEFSSASHTFAGIAFTAGKAIVRVSMRSRSCTAVTIGGVSATKAVESNAGGGASIWYLDGVSAGSHDVAVTGADNLSWVAIDTGAMTGAAAGDPTSTATATNNYYPDPQQTSTPLTVPESGVGLAAMFAADNTVTTSWVVGTEESDFGGGGNDSVVLTTARLLATGMPSVNGYNYKGSAMAAAAWGPA